MDPVQFIPPQLGSYQEFHQAWHPGTVQRSWCIIHNALVIKLRKYHMGIWLRGMAQFFLLVPVGFHKSHHSPYNLKTFSEANKSSDTTQLTWHRWQLLDSQCLYQPLLRIWCNSDFYPCYISTTQNYQALISASFREVNQKPRPDPSR